MKYQSTGVSLRVVRERDFSQKSCDFETDRLRWPNIRPDIFSLFIPIIIDPLLLKGCELGCRGFPNLAVPVPHQSGKSDGINPIILR
jgi:hypothetical protein